MSTVSARVPGPVRAAICCAALFFAAAAPNSLQAQFREVIEDTRDARTSSFAALVRVITTTVDPDSWDEVGGAGSIEPVDGWGMVIVSQTGDVHAKIADLIAVLRRARQIQEGDGKTKSTLQKAAPKSLVVEGERDAIVRKRIDAAMEMETSLEFKDASLSDVAEYLKSKHKIPVYIDEKALEEVGLSKDTVVTMSLKGVTLRSGIRLMLHKLGLSTVIKDDVLKISTPEKVESELITRLYLVKDLAIPHRGKVPRGTVKR